MTTLHPPRPASRHQIDWLTGELAHWQSAGWLDSRHADEILHSYRPTSRLSLSRLVLTLGAGFVGVGMIWLVAANLDALPPALRFGVVAAFWVVTTAGAEWLAGRREHTGSIPSPVVGAARSVASLAFGAVVFQAAQSLQVPAYEPKLVGFWALGVLVLGYATRAETPLVIGLGLAAGWYVWQVAWSTPDGLGVVLAFLVSGVVAASVATLHGRWWPDFAAPWREVAALLVLVGLFVAAIPEIGGDDVAWSASLVAGLATAGVLAVAAVTLGAGRAGLEPLVAAVLTAAAAGLVLWDPPNDPASLTASDVSHAVVAVVLYVAVAVLVAVLGVLHDSWRLTAMATVALVLFTTVQSFAVFARIIDGAWLFLLLGVVFLATGYGFDRARRELASTLEGDAS
ncbi:MAG: DUF2157 domain-containing protein [Nocardioides sp.]